MRYLVLAATLALGCGAPDAPPSFMEPVVIRATGSVSSGEVGLQLLGSDEIVIPLDRIAISLSTDGDHGALTRFSLPLGDLELPSVGLTLGALTLGTLTPARLTIVRREPDLLALRAHLPLCFDAEELGPMFTSIVDLDVEVHDGHLFAATHCASGCMSLPQIMMIDQARVAFDISAQVLRP